MTDEKKPARRKTRIIAALIGVALALTCQALPTDYQRPCQTIIALCTGGH
jgi:hypothetical protein